MLNNLHEILYKTETNHKQKKTLYLFCHCGHYDVLTRPGLFFKGHHVKYCPECEKFYTKATRHNISCRGIFFKCLKY